MHFNQSVAHISAELDQSECITDRYTHLQGLGCRRARRFMSLEDR